MTFINPYFLFGLFAAVIPILLHLFNLQKVRKMEFSTLMFLKEIQKSKLRRIRIKQILLLILRILIIVSLVFTFSNPVYKGYFAGRNPDIRKCGIFILDNSFSMGVKDDKGMYYEQAKNILSDLLKLYGSDDKLFLISSSHIKNFEKGELADAQTLLDSIKNLELTSVGFEVSKLINYADEIILKNNLPLSEVFLISDNTKVNFAQENTRGVLTSQDKNIHFYNIGIGKRSANNISIEKAEIKSKIPETEKEIKVSVILKNHNKFNCLNKQIKLFTGDKLADEKVVDLASLERKEVVLSFKTATTGSMSGYVELLQSDFFEDEVATDNKYYFSYYIPEKINIGLYAGSEPTAKYIKLAIESAQKMKETGGSIYKLNTYAEIDESVKNCDVIILTGIKNFSEQAKNTIQNYLKSGGGVLVFPSKDINIESYNLLLGKINSVRIENLARISTDTNSRSKFEKIDFEHPLFYGAFKNEQLSITSNEFYVESPDVKYIYKILPNENSKILITLPGKEAFLTETKTGEGKMVFCSVSADEEMSDFPRKSIFPMIINKSVLYLGSGMNEQGNYITGKNNIIAIGKNMIISIPYSEKYKEQGIYTVEDSLSNNKFFFALNRDSLESDFQKADLNDIKTFYDKNKIKNTEFITDADALNSTVLKAREGKELWKIFAALALIFILLEMAYAKKLEKL
jgi:hypothetical protein